MENITFDGFIFEFSVEKHHNFSKISPGFLELPVFSDPGSEGRI